MRLVPGLALIALLAAPAAARAQADLLGGRNLLDWMGLEPGDTLVFESGGEQSCVRVREPRAIRGGRYAELSGLRWPGLASDSRVLVPLDGTVGLSVIATPGPRPNPVALLPAATAFRAGTAPGLRSDRPAAPPAPPVPEPGIPVSKDGWYAAGTGLGPRRIVYVACSACMDAGTRVVFTRNGGIRSITSTTIAGTTTLTRVEGASCAERPDAGVEFEVYVLPQEDDRP